MTEHRCAKTQRAHKAGDVYCQPLQSLGQPFTWTNPGCQVEKESTAVTQDTEVQGVSLKNRTGELVFNIIAANTGGRAMPHEKVSRKYLFSSHYKVEESISTHLSSCVPEKLNKQTSNREHLRV